MTETAKSTEISAPRSWLDDCDSNDSKESSDKENQREATLMVEDQNNGEGEVLVIYSDGDTNDSSSGGSSNTNSGSNPTATMTNRARNNRLLDQLMVRMEIDKQREGNDSSSSDNEIMQQQKQRGKNDARFIFGTISSSSTTTTVDVKINNNDNRGSSNEEEKDISSSDDDSSSSDGERANKTLNDNEGDIIDNGINENAAGGGDSTTTANNTEDDEKERRQRERKKRRERRKINIIIDQERIISRQQDATAAATGNDQQHQQMREMETPANGDYELQREIERLIRMSIDIKTCQFIIIFVKNILILVPSNVAISDRLAECVWCPALPYAASYKFPNMRIINELLRERKALCEKNHTAVAAGGSDDNKGITITAADAAYSSEPVGFFSVQYEKYGKNIGGHISATTSIPPSTSMMHHQQQQPIIKQRLNAAAASTSLLQQEKNIRHSGGCELIRFIDFTLFVIKNGEIIDCAIHGYAGNINNLVDMYDLKTIYYCADRDDALDVFVNYPYQPFYVKLQNRACHVEKVNTAFSRLNPLSCCARYQKFCSLCRGIQQIDVFLDKNIPKRPTVAQSMSFDRIPFTVSMSAAATTNVNKSLPMLRQRYRHATPPLQRRGGGRYDEQGRRGGRAGDYLSSRLPISRRYAVLRRRRLQQQSAANASDDDRRFRLRRAADDRVTRQQRRCRERDEWRRCHRKRHHHQHQREDYRDILIRKREARSRAAAAATSTTNYSTASGNEGDDNDDDKQPPPRRKRPNMRAKDIVERNAIISLTDAYRKISLRTRKHL